WRLTNVSVASQLEGTIVGTDVERSAALEKAVAEARGKRVFWYSRAKDQAAADGDRVGRRAVRVRAR
ncbi:MAG TPA: hypothetical protein VJ691_10325, partial [Vicinamibacterales bacterium]|nr:hypothetical protein [Vicinamibacterales bacterium]